MGLAEEIDERGWAVVDLIGPDEVARLHARALTVLDEMTSPFHASSVSASRAEARAVDQELKAVLGPPATALLPGLTPFLASFITKGTQGGLVEIHQDWTYHDERQHRSTLLWCPLVDVDADSGALAVVSGSHRWSTAIRGDGAIPGLGDDVQDELWARAEILPLRAGQAVAYDAALLHGSTPTGGRVRPAAAIALGPAGAPLVHFHATPDGTLRGAYVDEAWFTTHPWGQLPEDATPLAPWTTATRPLHRDQLSPAPTG